jgi:glycosyltransferase involved in cell wall biosynthesis
VDHFIANSQFVAQRIRLYYGRDSEVIHPPIDTAFFTPDHVVPRQEFYLAAGALVPYKRFDLVIKAFNNLNRRLIVAGKGPELKRLRSLAGSNVQFLGWVSSEQLRHLYRTAKAMVFAGREDFGIVSAEAISTGCPVIAFGAGGSSEIIRDGVNGILFTEQDTKDLVCNIHRFETMSWPLEGVRLGVEGLSRAAFRAKIRRCIELQTTQQRPQEVLQSA